MKQDVELPAQVPKKRRAMERALDVWLPMWLARDDLTPSERKRIQAERERRKAQAPQDHAVGLLVAREGLTPAQMAGVQEALTKARPTEIHHPGVSSPLHQFCLSLGVPVEVHRDDMKSVVRCSTVAIGAPKESSEPTRKETGVWAMVSYAKHRRVPVRVINPTGGSSD